jgi:hypothetical protein
LISLPNALDQGEVSLLKSRDSFFLRCFTLLAWSIRQCLRIIRWTEPTMTQSLVICLPALLFCALLAAQTPSQPPQQESPIGFRIDTDVLEPGKAAPIHQSVTLFHNDQAWDYSLDAPHKITLVDYRLASTCKSSARTLRAPSASWRNHRWPTAFATLKLLCSIKPLARYR